jgi:hypothetical protein
MRLGFHTSGAKFSPITMKTNLKKLAEELATKDSAKARNLDVVAAQATLAALGEKLRESTTEEAIEIVLSITQRGGTRRGK